MLPTLGVSFRFTAACFVPFRRLWFGFCRIAVKVYEASRTFPRAGSARKGKRRLRAWMYIQGMISRWLGLPVRLV